MYCPQICWEQKRWEQSLFSRMFCGCCLQNANYVHQYRCGLLSQWHPWKGTQMCVSVSWGHPIRSLHHFPVHEEHCLCKLKITCMGVDMCAYFTYSDLHIKCFCKWKLPSDNNDLELITIIIYCLCSGLEGPLLFLDTSIGEALIYGKRHMQSRTFISSF